MFAEKFRPSKISDLIGNEQARLEIVGWLKNWKIGSKAIMVTGPPGVGKSSSVYAIANEFGYEVIEYNASDARTREKLRSAVGPLLQNTNIFGREEKLLVFLDEIDGLSGRADHAGMDFVLDFIENATLPVALAANVEEDPRLRKLEQKCKLVRFKPIGEDLLYIYLKHVAEQENIDVPVDTILEVAVRGRGDVRYALNTLQTITGWRTPSERTDKQFLSDYEALYSILESASMEEALTRLRQFDVQPRDKVRYFFDTVTAAKNFSIEERAESLDLIARADMLMGEIAKHQSWRLLRYMDRFLAQSSLSKHLKVADSSIPWNLKISIWNDGRVVREMASELSKLFHVGKSSFSSFYLPFLAFYFGQRSDAFSSFLKRNQMSDSEERVILKMARR